MTRKISRRQLLAATTAISSVAFAGLDAGARSISGEMPWAPGEADKPGSVDDTGYVFFTAAEAAFMDAAVARLIPADDLGPGAKEAGVTLFIDRQLAGAYGRGERWYMQGPWSDGTATQGYQTRLSPAQVYRAAIQSLDEHCRQTAGNRVFAATDPGEQDALLKQLEEGKIELGGADAKTFFDLLLQNTIEGFFADPIYGGNRNMIGWKLIGFPGARYDYRPYVARHNERLDLPPVGLRGGPSWTAKR